MRPHVIRASVITTLLNSNTPLHDVQAMVGHASADTTVRYWYAAPRATSEMLPWAPASRRTCR